MPTLVRLLTVSLVLALLAVPGHAQDPAAKPAGPTVRVGGYAQVRETYRTGSRLTATLNRVRVSAEGTIPGGFSFRVMPEYEAGGTATQAASVSLRDAYVRWTKDAFTLTAGQFKTPFSPQFITSIAQIETADRATAVDSLAPKRDIGLMAGYALGTWVELQAGIFNGEGQNRIVNVDSTNLFVGRVGVRPVPYLTLGGNVAHWSTDSTRWGADAALEWQGVTVKGEYLWQPRSGREADKGWYALAAYKVVPSVQLVLMQERFVRPGVSAGQRQVATTGGVNVWLAASRIRLLANYVSREIGTPSTRSGTVVSQLQVRF